MSLMAQVDRARSTLQAANEQLSEARGILGKPKQEAPKEPEEKGLFDRVKDAVSNVSLSDVGHTVLDIAGLVPVLGAPADGINAVWYLAEGDKTNAALSAAGMLPIAGEAATAARLGNRAVDAVRTADNAVDAARTTDNAIDAARTTDNALDTARLDPTSADVLLEQGRKCSGDFPKEAGPNEVLYREGSDGRVTYYQVYDAEGLPLKRVDLDPNSRIHNNIPPPHVQEFTRNTNPATGETFVGKPSNRVRRANPAEIPNVK